MCSDEAASQVNKPASSRVSNLWTSSISFCIFLSSHPFTPPTIFLLRPSNSSSTPLPPPPRHDAQPGGSVLMHRGTFCSSESQRQQGLRSDRMATSLGISAHAAAAQHQGRLRGEDRGNVVGGVRGEPWFRRRHVPSDQMTVR